MEEKHKSAITAQRDKRLSNRKIVKKKSNGPENKVRANLKSTSDRNNRFRIICRPSSQC